MNQCPTCFGRGYKPKAKPYTGDLRGTGLYIRTCWRCRGAGYLEPKEKSK